MRQIRKIFALLAFLCCSAATAVYAQTQTVAETGRSLRQVHIGADDSPTDVPEEVRTLFPVFKHQLRDLIAASLDERCHSVLKPEEIRTALLDTVKAEGVMLSSEFAEEDEHSPFVYDLYGFLADIRVERPAGHPDMLAIVVSLSIPYGNDSSLYLFEYTAEGWKLVFSAEVNGYEEISGAPGWLHFKISPSDEQGDWFVVTTDVSPWPSSNWQGLRVNVLRRGEIAESPRKLLHEENTIYLGVDEPQKLDATVHGFQLQFEGSQSLDGALITRTHLRTFTVIGNEVTRVPPLALAPEDFLDEWLEMPWEEAEKWVESFDHDDLKLWHERLQRTETSQYSTSFDVIQACGMVKDPTKWQIGLLLESYEDKELPPELPGELYFMIVRKDGAFYVSAVSTAPQPSSPVHSDPESLPSAARLP